MTSKKNNLPVWLIAVDAYGSCVVNLPIFSRVALIPFCLTVLIGFAVGFVAALMGHRDLFLDPFSPSSVVVVSIQRIFWIIFAVAWHRFILLGPGRARTTSGIDIKQRELDFFAYVLVIFFISVGPYYVVMMRIITPVGWLALVLLYWPWLILPLVARMSLVLPAAAIERRISFAQAWTMTRGATWRVVSIGVLCGLPLSILFQLTYGPLLLSVAGSFPLMMLVEMAGTIIVFLQIAIAAAGLSLTYRWFSQRNEQQTFV